MNEETLQANNEQQPSMADKEQPPRLMPSKDNEEQPPQLMLANADDANDADNKQLPRSANTNEEQPQSLSANDNEEQPAFAGIAYGDAPREDSFPAPHVDWRWGEDADCVLMTDYSLAASIAITAIFGPISSTLLICMCSVHAWKLWADTKHRADFKDYAKNRSKMGRDFERYKRVPHVSLVAPARDLMMLRWHSYKEKKVAELWEKQWATTKHTMAEVNQSSYLF
jgi:hypothetical protein